jgi:hypothetical protein
VEHDWKVEITHDGVWPTKWRWSVLRKSDCAIRVGESFTKQGAERAVVKARLSIEREDVRIEL